MPEDNPLQSQQGQQGAQSGQPGSNPRLWAGKYKNEQELETGYVNLVGEISRVGEENKQLRERIDAIMPMLTGPGAGGGQTQPGASAADRLAERMGVDPNELLSFVRTAARDEVRTELAPLAQGLTARQTIGQEIPDFGTNEPKINEFLTTNPKVAERYSAMLKVNPAAAFDYADAAWRRANPSPRQSANGADLAQARLDSLAQGGSGSGPGSANSLDDLTNEYNSLREAYMKSRSPRNRDALINFQAKLASMAG